MPYLRSGYRRRKPKSAYRRRNPKNALMTRSMTKRLVNRLIETKFLISNQSPTFITDAGTIFQQNVLGQGTDIGQRIGDQIRHKSIQIRFALFNANQIFCRVRCILFWWRMETLGSPSATDILETTSSPAAPVSAYKFRNEGEFQVIYDRVYTLCSNTSSVVSLPVPGVAGAVEGMPVHNVVLTKNLKNKVGSYVGATSGDNMAKGYLGLLFISDVANAAANAQRPQIQFSSYLRYTDG